MDFITKQVSSLQRVFLDGKCDLKEYNTDSALKGERFSYQIAYKSDENGITNSAKEAKPAFFPMCFFRLRISEY